RAGHVEASVPRVVVDDVDPVAGLRARELLPVAGDVEYGRTSFGATHEEPTLGFVERDSTRSAAAVRPARDELPVLQIDRHARAFPEMRVRAVPRLVDDEGLRTAGDGHPSHGVGRGARSSARVEDLDLLRVGLGDPELVRARDESDVVGAPREGRSRNDLP